MSGASDSRSERGAIADAAGVNELSPAYDVQTVRFRYGSRGVDPTNWILDDVSVPGASG